MDFREKCPSTVRGSDRERKRGVFISFPLQSWMKLNAGNQSPGVFIIIPFRVLLLQHVEPAVRCVVVSSGSVIVTGPFFFFTEKWNALKQNVLLALCLSRGVHKIIFYDMSRYDRKKSILSHSCVEMNFVFVFFFSSDKQNKIIVAAAKTSAAAGVCVFVLLLFVI